MSSLESFRPRLRPGHIHSSDHAVVFETNDGLHQATLDPQAKTFLPFFDGTKTVREIVSLVFDRDGKISFRALISAVLQLSERSCLEETIASAPTTTSTVLESRFQFWERPLFSLPVVSRSSSVRASRNAFFVFASLVVGLSIAGVAGFLSQLSAISIVSNTFLHIDESYLRGLVFFVAATSVLISAKNLLRFGLSLLLTGRASRLQLELNFYSLALRTHDDTIYATGSRFTSAMAAIAVFTAQFATFALVWLISSDWSLLPDLFVITLLLALVDLNPYRQSDLTSFFNLARSRTAAKHLLPYLKSRSLVSALNKKDVVEDQILLVVYSTCAIAWTFIAFNLTLTIIDHNYPNLLTSILANQNVIESAAAFAILAATVIVALSLAYDVLKTIALNLASVSANSRLAKRVRSEEISRDPARLQSSLRELPLFKDLPASFIDHVISLSKVRKYEKDALIIVQGAPSEELFVLLEGEAVVRQRQASGAENIVARFSAPVVFGESTLLDDGKRTADVIAKSECTVLAAPKPALTENSSREQIIDRLRLGQYVSSSDLFRSTPREVVSLFLAKGEIVHRKPGETIIKQGDLDRDFYLLIRGRVSVSILDSKSGIEREVRTLGEGDFFGEIALLFNRARTATIRCTENATLLKLSGDAYWSLISENLSLSIFLETVSESRLREDEKITAHGHGAQNA